jgi:hypothetical protein
MKEGAMDTERELMTVKEGAAYYDPTMNVETFRRKLCGPKGILAERHGLRVRKSQRRVIRIVRAVLQEVMDEERGLAG